MRLTFHHQSFSSRSLKKKKSRKTIIFIYFVLFLGIFFVSIQWFRESAARKLSQLSSPQEDSSQTEILFPQQKMEEIKLLDKTNTGSSATVKREIISQEEFSPFHLMIEAQLPQIDPQTFTYEVWLLCPLPFNFFSVGTLTQNTDGIFSLEWTSPQQEEKDYFSYTKVIITKEIHDNNLDPSEHILEGEFHP
jgi:hypothetical protein